jgi:hypothetical protein
LAARLPDGRKLGIEALVIGGLIVLVGFLVYHFTVHTIRNTRPLGGPNIDVTPATFDQSQASFALDPGSPRVIFGASSDKGLEVLRVSTSSDGGTTWRSTDGPAVPGGSCAHGAPSVAVGANGRQYLAFLASPYCGDSLTPHLVVTSRSASARWSRLIRVAPAAWKYGFDDAPDLALDDRSGRLYVVWTRGVSKRVAEVVVSASADGGATWSPPSTISGALDHAHNARVALAANGDVYVAGIDAKLGLWVARSTNEARTFSPPRMAAPLRANPAAGCALTAQEPLPKEQSACVGPDPTLSVGGGRVYVVYGDVGANGTPDVYAAALDASLKPLFHVQVNPADKGKTQQFMPTSALDATTGALWACWYDTTFDPNAHRAWFTCSASHGGRTWTPPLKAASEPTSPTILYGTLGTSGLYPALAAGNGVAHAFWADGRVIANSSDVFTAAIPERVAFAVKGP